MTQGYTFYASEVSYFSGKVRAYLRYKRIPFSEMLNTREAYLEVILPRVGWPVIPVVITPEGGTLQDSTEIIDELERRFPTPPIYPSSPRQRLAALLLEVYGDEWLKLPAMHYRWNRNYEFAIAEFGAMQTPGAPADEQREAGLRISKPFAGALPFLGVTPKTESAIEESYLGLLDELNVHFGTYEFLFGTRPSMGDFGLFGPLYAHQYRDPASGELMKSRAPHVARWVERMMTPPNPKGGEFLPRDEVPIISSVGVPTRRTSPPDRKCPGPSEPMSLRWATPKKTAPSFRSNSGCCNVRWISLPRWKKTTSYARPIFCVRQAGKH